MYLKSKIIFLMVDYRETRNRWCLYLCCLYYGLQPVWALRDNSLFTVGSSGQRKVTNAIESRQSEDSVIVDRQLGESGNDRGLNHIKNIQGRYQGIVTSKQLGRVLVERRNFTITQQLFQIEIVLRSIDKRALT